MTHPVTLFNKKINKKMNRISDFFPYGCGIEDRPIMATQLQHSLQPFQRRKKVKERLKPRINQSPNPLYIENVKKEEERIRRQLEIVAEQILLTKEADDAKNMKKDEENECCICMDNFCNVLFVPCKHNCVCTACSESLSACPLCRKGIKIKNQTE